MKVSCTTIVKDERQRKDLCQRIEDLGAMPEVVGDTVFADYDGEDSKAKELIDLFRQYPYYGVSIL